MTVPGNQFSKESGHKQLYPYDNGHQCQVEQRLVSDLPELQSSCLRNQFVYNQPDGYDYSDEKGNDSPHSEDVHGLFPEA